MPLAVGARFGINDGFLPNAAARCRLSFRVYSDHASRSPRFRRQRESGDLRWRLLLSEWVCIDPPTDAAVVRTRSVRHPYKARGTNLGPSPSMTFYSDYTKRPVLSRLPPWLSRWFGYRATPPNKPPKYIAWLWSWIGAFCGLSVIMAVLGQAQYFINKKVPMLVASYVC